ncbi:tautomerase family protein [Cupriavidus necator]|uniref:tautomerase family protein n=1 Tax=Cupriavidus necator TaxID=106590 RepID=UPI0039C3CAF3
MPLIRFDILEGRTEEQIRHMLAASHRAMLKAFNVPDRDRYQVVTEHKSFHMVVQDTGLDIPRTNDVVLVSVFTRPRTEQEKLTFYRELCDELHRSCNIAPEDVVISLVSNTDADWSFGMGRAQFITNELPGSDLPFAHLE